MGDNHPIVAIDKQLRDAFGLAYVGVSLGKCFDKSTWRVDWKDDQATDDQRAQAQTIIDAFDLAPYQDGTMKKPMARGRRAKRKAT